MRGISLLYIYIGVLYSVLDTPAGFFHRYGKPFATTYPSTLPLSITSTWTARYENQHLFEQHNREEHFPLYSTSTTTSSSPLPDPIGKTQLKLITFNVLAPCYKRERKKVITHKDSNDSNVSNDKGYI